MKEIDTFERIQAYLDGELPESEHAEVAALLDADESLQGLYDELIEGRDLLRTHEPQRSVPEPRDFYWSKIAQGIEKVDQAGVPVESSSQQKRRFSYWVKWLLPVGGLAAVLFLAMLSQFGVPKGAGTQAEKASSYHEMDNPLETGSLISFRSNSEGVTVLWITSD